MDDVNRSKSVVLYCPSPTSFYLPLLMRSRNRALNLKNCARSSQEEHMVLITETGADVLTR